MDQRKHSVFAICGSTRRQSTNLQFLEAISTIASDVMEVHIFTGLTLLPHFNPDADQDGDSAPEAVQALRSKIADADGVLICTPEYVFSLPGSLKNAIEWTVSTTLFSEKPVALITASGQGKKAHEALCLIMKTIYADVRECGQLLISGARSKLNERGEITDETTLQKIKELISCFNEQMSLRSSVPSRSQK